MLYASLAAFVAAIVGLDQWTKWLTVRAIETTSGAAVIPAIPGVFHITHVKNTGAAWSMLEGQRWLFIAVSLLFFAAVGFMIWKKYLTKKFELWCLAAIVGGAIGNLIDRIATGAVTDMICLDFISFPVFNVADCFVTCGCVLLFVYILFFDRKKEPADEVRS
ncbi:MAG: signal peptidase II [Oscillospiraceae bacterium]|jgi:signal peptidase II|nr:signal peptidase II [Oscillospiraceae bacterium]